jgi:hypothetical protein
MNAPTVVEPNSIFNKICDAAVYSLGMPKDLKNPLESDSKSNHAILIYSSIIFWG